MALQLDPDFVTALHNLGTVNLTTGNAVEALKYFERAIEIDPKFVPAYGNLAVIHLGKGEKEEAIHNLQKNIGIAKF